MSISTKTTIDELAAGLSRLQNLVDDRDLNAAEKLASELLAKTRRAGIDSAFFAWVRAVLADYSSEFVNSLTLIQEAMTLDPLALPIRHSFKVIVRNVRACLSDPQRAADFPSTPELWNLLVRAGEADDGSHLAMARFRLAKGNELEAMRLVDSVTTLSPGNAEAWLLKSTVATQLGDHKLAARAAAEAAALGERNVSFGTQPQAQA